MNAKKYKELEKIKRIMKEQDVCFEIARFFLRTNQTYYWKDTLNGGFSQRCEYGGSCSYPCEGC